MSTHEPASFGERAVELCKEAQTEARKNQAIARQALNERDALREQVKTLAEALREMVFNAERIVYGNPSFGERSEFGHCIRASKAVLAIDEKEE